MITDVLEHLATHRLAWGTIAYGALDALLRIIALIIVPERRRPGSAIAWLLAIMALPVLFFPVYLVFGRTQLPRKRRERQRYINGLMRERAESIPDSELDSSTASWLRSAVTLNRELGAFPLTGNNDADIETDYARALARMARDIRGAREQVHALFYTMVLDDATREVIDALADAADRGVQVRVLYDHVGSLSHRRHYRAMRRVLDAHGIAHHPMMPLTLFSDGALQRPDIRNHRKLLVVDGQVAWIGSQNIIARHYDKPVNIRRGLAWQETMVRLQGPIVAECNLLFATDWYFESHEQLPLEQLVRPPQDTSGSFECQLLPSGPGFELRNNLLLFTHLFHSAQRRIVAVSPYLVPEETILAALITAARRGVEVELFVSELGDQFLVHHAQRSYYQGLLEAGITIRLYRPPGILHAKHITIDDTVTLVGSSNMDPRSFEMNMEAMLMVGGPDFRALMGEAEEEYRRCSRVLTLQEWQARPRAVKIVENLARLASSIV